jgi:tyrosine-specific transport protein
VAYISRASQSIADTTGQPSWLTAAFFSTALAGLCYAASPRLLDVASTVLLALVVVSFLSLLWIALPGVTLENLQSGSWPAVVDTLPVVALAFVYQNVVPVIVTKLEGDVRKVRLAVWTGLAIPLVMFVGWEGAMLGSIAPGVHHCQLTRPLMSRKCRAHTCCSVSRAAVQHPAAV